MSIRAGLVVVLRAFVILIVLQLVTFCLALASNGGSLNMIVSQIAMLSLILIPCLLLYWCAGGIVDLLAPARSEARPDEHLSQAYLQEIAFSAVGAYILYQALRDTTGILAALALANRTGVGSETLLPNILGAVFGFCAGLYLLIGAPGLNHWLATIRSTGRQQED